MPNFEVSQKPKEETTEEVVAKAQKKWEEANGNPKGVGDLFGGDTLDEKKPEIRSKKESGIARAQRNVGSRNVRRRGNTLLENMLPPSDR